MPKGHRRGKRLALSTRTRQESGLLRYNINAAITDEHRRAVEARRRIKEIERRRREDWDLD